MYVSTFNVGDTMKTPVAIPFIVMTAIRALALIFLSTIQLAAMAEKTGGSDWSIYRGGTVRMEGSRNCAIRNCRFDAGGGNAVFMNDTPGDHPHFDPDRTTRKPSVWLRSGGR
jgi:hypothetical protein